MKLEGEQKFKSLLTLEFLALERMGSQIPQFTGRLGFKDQKQLTKTQFNYLRVFKAYHHHGLVHRHLAEQAEDPVRTATGLPLGPDCCFFLDSGLFVLM